MASKYFTTKARKSKNTKLGFIFILFRDSELSCFRDSFLFFNFN